MVRKGSPVRVRKRALTICREFRPASPCSWPDRSADVHHSVQLPPPPLNPRPRRRARGPLERAGSARRRARARRPSWRSGRRSGGRASRCRADVTRDLHQRHPFVDAQRDVAAAQIARARAGRRDLLPRSPAPVAPVVGLPVRAIVRGQDRAAARTPARQAPLAQVAGELRQQPRPAWPARLAPFVVDRLAVKMTPPRASPADSSWRPAPGGLRGTRPPRDGSMLDNGGYVNLIELLSRRRRCCRRRGAAAAGSTLHASRAAVVGSQLRAGGLHGDGSIRGAQLVACPSGWRSSPGRLRLRAWCAAGVVMDERVVLCRGGGRRRRASWTMAPFHAIGMARTSLSRRGRRSLRRCRAWWRATAARRRVDPRASAARHRGRMMSPCGTTSCATSQSLGEAAHGARAA